MKGKVIESIASVYVMRQLDSDYYKIGVSNYPLGRVNDISNGNPFGVELLMYGMLLKPYEREAELHAYFADERIRPNGEWFELCKMGLKSVEETLEYWVQEDKRIASSQKLELHDSALVFRKAPDLRRVVISKPKEKNIDDYL